MRAIGRGVMVGLVAAITVTALSTHAEPTAADRGKIAELTAKGTQAARRKDYPACIDAYASALQIEETAAVLGELGLCEAAAGRNLDAYRHFASALRSPALDPKGEAYKRFDDGFARVGLRIAQVFIAVDPPSAAVVIDGRPLGKADGRRVPMEPGSHTIRARVDGYEDAVQTVTLEAGSTPTVHLVMKAKPQAAPAVTAAAATTPAPARSAVPAAEARPLPGWLVARPERIALVVAAGLGAATALASGATAIGLQVDRASYSSKLTGSSCFAGNASLPPECAAVHERALQRNAAVDVSLGALVVTGAAVAAAGVLYGVDRRSSYPPSIVPTVSLNGGGIVVVGSF